MAVRNRRIFDFDSQSDDSQSYGYGGGGGACPQINTALHRDCRMGVVDHEISVNSPWENLNVS